MRDGVTASYLVYYSSIMETGEGIHNVNGSTNSLMFAATWTTSVTIGELNPSAFYALTVVANFNPIQNPSGVGIGV